MTQQTILTDTEILDRMREHDAAAFKMLFDRYWERLYVFAYNRLKSDADAQDVVQELMINLWLRRSKISIETTVSAYLFSALRYEVMAQLSRSLKMADKKADIEQHILPEFTSGLDPLLQKELLALIDAEISKLPPKMQEVYRLRQEEDLSVEEIAQKLNLSEQTVRNQLNAGSQRLRSSLRKAVLAAIFLPYLN